MSCNPNPPEPKSASACSSASRGVSGVVTWYRIGSPLRAHPLGAHEAGTGPASLEMTERTWRTRKPHLAPRDHSPNAESKTRARRTARHDAIHGLVIRHATAPLMARVLRGGYVHTPPFQLT